MWNVQCKLYFNIYNNAISFAFLATQTTDQCQEEVVNYLITHTVSSDQSPITVNRTNVTLYGVQPGEAYIIEIIQNNRPELRSKFIFQTG